MPSKYAIETDDRENSGFYYWFDVTETIRQTIKGVPKVITIVKWTLTAELENCPDCGETHVVSFDGTTPILPRTASGGVNLSYFDAENAIAYEDVTLDQVVEWIHSAFDHPLSHDALHGFVAIEREINKIHLSTSNNRSEDKYTDNLPWMDDDDENV